MERYQNKSRTSGVTAFAIGPDFIRIRFTKEYTDEAWEYLYTYRTPGRKRVEEMKRRASAGVGLATYIAQEVKNDFAEKKRCSE